MPLLPSAPPALDSGQAHDLAVVGVGADVYVRLTPKGRKPPFRSMLVTQLVSGVWHGLLPGYAMFLMGSAFMFENAKVIYRYETSSTHAGLRSFAPWILVKGLYTALCLNFLASAFLVRPGLHALRLQTATPNPTVLTACHAMHSSFIYG